jgi:serine/threonine protein kinase
MQLTFATRFDSTLCTLFFPRRLKRQKTIPEKDAKAIFMQIMSGLRYLDRPLSYGTTTSAAGGACASGPGTAGGVREDGRYFDADEDGHGNNNHHGGGGNKSNKKFSIIHYDLKPANILFDEIGDVKITGTIVGRQLLRALLSFSTDFSTVAAINHTQNSLYIICFDTPLHPSRVV